VRDEVTHGVGDNRVGKTGKSTMSGDNEKDGAIKAMRNQRAKLIEPNQEAFEKVNIYGNRHR
jgi:hypothetical protein